MPRKLPDLKKNVDEIPAVQSRLISRLPFIAGFCGSTKSGKTYLAVSLLYLLMKEGSINRLYIISPTARQNPLLKAIYDEENSSHFMFEDCSSKVFETLRWIESDMDSQADLYADALQYQIAYNKHRKGEALTEADHHMLESYGYALRKAVRPKAVLLLDDVQSTAVLSSRQSNPFTNLVIKSRWIGRGLGLSICMLTQTYKSNAVPRALRLNLTHLALFNTQNREEVRNMYEEVGTFVSKDKFEELFARYTAPKHGYMWCDFVNKRLTDSF